MKKYNQIMILSVVVYVFLAIFTGVILFKMQKDDNHEYRVESQRIISQITDVQQINHFDLSQYEYSQDISFLDEAETDQTIINAFYQEPNDSYVHIVPFYQNQQLIGYIKITYLLPQYNVKDICIILQISLLILEIFILSILVILKKTIILPFQKLTNMPIELSKGHFKDDIKEEKNRYFGQFIWGMSQLKDELDVSKKRQLELLKEKKRMLLSLSHDMKTPLNLIKLYSKALYQDVYHDEKSQKYAIQQIGIKTNEIERYIDEIVQSSREDILDLQVQNQEFYLQDLINKVMSIYQEQCSLRQIELIVSPFENKIINGDLERSQEVFENILENAFKYGDGRKIEISFYEEDYCQLIRIFNTGESVSDTEFNHIFESFYRGSNSKGKQGHGLGLYICHELMSKMDGAIFAEKNDNGMAFILVFR